MDSMFSFLFLSCFRPLNEFWNNQNGDTNADGESEKMAIQYKHNDTYVKRPT